MPKRPSAYGLGPDEVEPANSDEEVEEVEKDGVVPAAVEALVPSERAPRVAAPVAGVVGAMEAEGSNLIPCRMYLVCIEEVISVLYSSSRGTIYRVTGG